MSLGGLLKNSLSPVAIDFGVASLKALQVARWGEGVQLVGASLLETPPELLEKPMERVAFQVDSIPQLLREGGFKGKRAVCSVSATLTLVQHVFTPKSAGVSIDAAVAEQARMLTGRDPSQLILRTIEVGEVMRKGAKGTESICIAMSREVVLHAMQALRKCRLDTVGVHSEHLSALTCLHAMLEDKPNADMPTVFADIGYATTKIMVARGRTLLTARTLHLGGRDIDIGEARRTTRKTEEARALRIRGWQAATTQPVSAAACAPAALRDAGSADPRPIERTLAIICDEIELATRYARSLAPADHVGRCVLFGGEARMVGACEAVGRRLGIPAYIASPMSSVEPRADAAAPGIDFRSPQPGWVVPLGMCLAPTDL